MYIAGMNTRPPSDAGRNVIRVQITMLPADLVELDAVASEMSEPGMARNRSGAFRRILREWLNDRADTGRSKRGQ